ncbi:MAG: chromosome segregation protein SMC [Nanoarchaeota archaeon]|nr:chromosome segregation protein SMC [Nanoarchaeota archaeon]
MVRIDKIEMQGFKSFAKKTLLTFPSNFSCVCGPNGSGKSNVLDAMCFVLGRTSAKSLRADKMHEVVFNGGQNKQAADFAKVKLHFDNSDKGFPIEDDSVTISRKVNTKGISIYKLNGKTVTRETIMEILRSVHIYPDGDNIILQGQVSDIIESSPRERREKIDRIAGISEFEQKRNKAQNELGIVEARLTRNVAILGEKETNLKRLEIERRSAKEYKNITEELEKIKASIVKINLKEAEDGIRKMEERLKEVSDKKSEKELQKLDSEIEKLENEKSSATKSVFERKDIDIIKRIEALKTEINTKAQRALSNKYEIQRIDELIKNLEFIQGDSENRVASSILKLNRTGVYGTISKLSSVPREYQIAIEVTAGGHLNDIITRDKEIAIDCVKYLKENKIGRTTFLPLDKIQPRDDRNSRKLLKEDGVVGIAIDLIKFDEKYDNAFSFIFGDTIIVKTINDAKRIGIGSARFVTLDGDLIEKSGAIIGGFYKSNKRVFSGSDISTHNKKKEELKAEIIGIEFEMKALDTELKIYEAKEASESSEVKDKRNETLEIEIKLSDIRQKRRFLFEAKVNADVEIGNIRTNRARLEAALENIQRDFETHKNTQTYDMKPEVLESKQIELSRKLGQLGPVNQKALADYDEQKLIYDDLRQKVDKLTEERNRVISMIAEVEGRRKECFMKTFNAIAGHFKTVYSDMTHGIGILKLEDETDIESGLLIEASPPGKKLTNIDSLSGGEKTVTALAFLFAVQQFSPAPFYVLDEIDAALDKPNTKKITELIKKYSSKAEFIVISHNDVTIQAADIVYGVSMDNGESNLIAIRMPGA